MPASCNYCFLAPGFTDVSSAQIEYLLFTAYSMTSAFSQDGFCATISGASTPIQTPYWVAKPTAATTNPVLYQAAAAARFVSFLDVPDWGICGENGSLAVHMANADTTAVVNVEVQTTLGAALPTYFASPSNTANLAVTTSSLPATASTGLSNRAKATIGLVVSIVLLALLLPGGLLLYQYRKQRAAIIERKIQEKLETETETEFPRGV